MTEDKNNLEITLYAVGEDFMEEDKSSLDFQFMYIGHKKWQFHKSDPDKWPSVPHGHNYQENQKINVYTGEVFQPKTKKYLGKLKNKFLKDMQKELKNKGYIPKESLSKLIVQ
jgi:hypothetical protein